MRRVLSIILIIGAAIAVSSVFGNPFTFIAWCFDWIVWAIDGVAKVLQGNQQFNDMLKTKPEDLNAMITASWILLH